MYNSCREIWYFLLFFYSVCSLDILSSVHVQRCLNAFSRRFLDLPFHNGQCKVQWGVSCYFIHKKHAKIAAIWGFKIDYFLRNVTIQQCVFPRLVGYFKREGVKNICLGRQSQGGSQILCGLEGGGKFWRGLRGIFRKGVPRFAYVIWLWMDAPNIFGEVVIWGSHINPSRPKPFLPTLKPKGWPKWSPYFRRS